MTKLSAFVEGGEPENVENGPLKTNDKIFFFTLSLQLVRCFVCVLFSVFTKSWSGSYSPTDVYYCVSVIST